MKPYRDKRTDLIILLALAVLAIFAGSVIYNELTAPQSTLETDSVLDFYPDPIQTEVDTVFLEPLQRGKVKFLFTPQASYSITATLVSKRSYAGGPMNWLSPMDYALAWGSLNHLLDKIKFKQVVRFCLYRTREALDPAFINRHMSNNHLIPATPNLRKALRRVKKGSVVKLDGYLVYVTALQGGRVMSNWNSSLTRTDEGNGACEIIYLTRLQVGDRVYQ